MDIQARVTSEEWPADLAVLKPTKVGDDEDHLKRPRYAPDQVTHQWALEHDAGATPCCPFGFGRSSRSLTSSTGLQETGRNQRGVPHGLVRQ
jgi:hypothetical protein